MKAELIQYMGTDLTVVNSARVSFDKESSWCHRGGEPDVNGVHGVEEQVLGDKDQKLINYLAKHNHWTPFSHVMITMRETVPIFVARQRFKHMIGFSYNEVSRRYVDTPPEFFYPDEWRKFADNKKQGSSEEVITSTHVQTAYEKAMSSCRIAYDYMLAQGVAPEQARMVLPQSMMTSYYVTGSLSAWARAYKLRSDPHAQKEIQDLATQWQDIIGNIDELKYSWKALTTEA